ncbi:MAG: heavy metal-responsive transcriptional regulator [Chloroflexi bacterium]|nr:heavy metal-responsive transcriptional regulator [Chloroflexota bacterium]
MKIGELANATGLTAKTIRFYEDEGLLPPAPRTSSGYRIYGDEDVVRLEFVRKAKRLGLTLEDIKSILRLHDSSEPTCAHVRSLLDEKLAEVDRAIADLQRFRAALSDIRDRAGDIVDCRPEGGVICSIIEDVGAGAAS